MKVDSPLYDSVDKFDSSAKDIDSGTFNLFANAMTITPTLNDRRMVDVNGIAVTVPICRFDQET